MPQVSAVITGMPEASRFEKHRRQPLHQRRKEENVVRRKKFVHLAGRDRGLNEDGGGQFWAEEILDHFRRVFSNDEGHGYAR